jgi:hypothetical protein
LILTRGRLPSVDVSNVLNEEKKQQVIAFGRLGWSLRKIQKTTGVRRETAADYLRAAGIGLRPPGGWGRSAPAKPANEVTPDPQPAKPANRAEVIPDSGAVLASPPAATANASAGRSACEPHRETIELELSKGRNAKGIWQDLVDRSGFAGGYQSVKRFIVGLRGKSSPEACAVIETAPGEDYGEPRVMVRNGGGWLFGRQSQPQTALCVLHNALKSFEPLDEAR